MAKIEILHAGENDDYTVVFEWNTKKAGIPIEIANYAIGKFGIPQHFPKGYEHRPVKQNDRIRVTITDGRYAGQTATFHLITSSTILEI